jgi:FemAB-related protein (PEP-CTERM system-associated)
MSGELTVEADLTRSALHTTRAPLQTTATSTPPRSSVRVDAADGAATAACEAYVGAHPSAIAYHRPGWLRVIDRAFGHRGTYFVATRDEAIVGVLPLVVMSSRLFGRFAVSVPFVNYGGVLADDADTVAALVEAAVAATERAGGAHLELRHTARLCPTLQARRHKVSMTLPLEATPDAQWQAIDRKLRNQVRKAEKSGLEVRSGGIELVPDFYRVFTRNMRDLGTPVYGVRFFEEVLREFADTTRVFVVTSAGHPAAASIVHWFRDRIEVPWASAIREYNPLCANVLLYWAMLKFSCESHFATFDFGRSTPDEGPYQFKKQWGAQPTEMIWEYWTANGRRLPDLSPHNPKFALAVRTWQRLPVPVATALGPFIVRNIP